MSFFRALKRIPPPSPSVLFVLENEDLLIQVLVFLPPKALIKLKSVNRQWHAVISSEHFCRLHTQYFRHRPKPLPSFLLHSGKQHFFYFNPYVKTFIPFRFRSPYTYIVQSCNGLLLLECSNKQHGRRAYYIHNPVTDQFRKLTFSDRWNELRAPVPNLCLVFDPSKSNDFKVICIWKIPSLTQVRVEVYTGSSRSWEELGTPLTSSRFATFCNGIYLDGGIYWIRPSSDSYILDPESGIFRTPPVIKPPPRKVGQSNKNYIMESNGHLHSVSYFSRPNEYSMNVFEMDSEASEWLQTHQVDLNPVAEVFNEIVDRDREVSVLGIVRGEKEEQSAVLILVPGKIICYWLHDGSFELSVDLTELGYGEDRFLFGRAQHFIETLVPV